MAKIKIELTEAEIKDAVKMWAVNHVGTSANFKTVTINVSENRDAMDRPGFGHTVTAMVSEWNGVIVSARRLSNRRAKIALFAGGSIKAYWHFINQAVH